MSLRFVVPAVAAVALSALAVAWAAGEPQPYAQADARAMSRVLYFGEKGIAGQYSVQYGKPAWRADFDGAFEKLRGKRIRLGKDWWTTFDTFSPLTFGEKTEVPEGAYFLCLALSDKSEWSLIALDPAPIRKAHMDAYMTDRTTGGIQIPMKYEVVADEAAELSISFVPVEDKPTARTLEIRFGKHRLSTTVVAKL